VARLDTWKQPEIFLDLARSFPQNSFTLIGPPAHDHAYEQSIQDAAKEISNLRFIGGVPFAETDTYFQQAKIFINTSLYEGFPNTFVQAMMHGVPILSLTVDPDAFLEKNEVGYCAKNNLTAMKSLLEALLKDDALHQRISARAYRYAADHHDIRKTSQKFLTLLEECYAQ
jgi:glycosyltransferase involved in cell wall biosynthesis